MILKKIRVENFRNIKETELEFSDNVNIFYGNNAQGKTNLLEAIAIALGKSFRNIKKTDIVPFNNKDIKTRIKLFYTTRFDDNKINDILFELEIKNYNIVSNIVKINSIPLNKAKDLYGEFKFVTFIPDNLNLIKGYPNIRRNYLDNIAIMQNKSHRKFLNEYKKTLKQSCSLYYSNKNIINKDLFEVWNDILIKQGINLTYGRVKFLKLIKEYAIEIYNELSRGEKLLIRYYSDIFKEINEISYFNGENLDNLYSIYKKSLLNCDKKNQTSKIPGVHKDDILFSINGNNLKDYGSQGQLRSVAIALKLAEAQLILNYNKEKPIMLLDEILSELDEKRREFVVKQQGNSQIFITSCNINDFKNQQNIKIWEVDNGVFTPR